MSRDVVVTAANIACSERYFYAIAPVVAADFLRN
jgi:hypothetical protein